MIPMIQQAITMGYTAAQILNYISKKFKTAAPGISSAKQQGYSDEDILKYLGNKIKPKNKKGVENQLSDQEKYLKSVGMKTKGEKEETRNKFISGAINLGLTGLGAYNMYQGFKGLGQTFGQGGTAPQPLQLPGGLPPGPNSPGVQVLNTPTPGAPINPPPGVPQTPGQMATPATPMPGPNIGQQVQGGAQSPITNAMQPQTPNQLGQAAQAQQQSIFEQLLGGVDIESLDPSTKQQLTFLGMISDQLESKGKTLADPEFKKLADKIKKALQGKSGMLMEEVSRGMAPEALKTKPATTENVKNLVQNWNEAKKQNPNFPHSLSKVLQRNLGLEKDIADRLAKTYQEDYQEAKEPEPQKIEPQSIVSTPQGVGEVKGVSNGKAIVEIDGKAHKIDEKDIEPPPIPEKDLADLHNDLIAGIEKATGKEVSRHVDWAGYDPNANELLYKPWGGPSYTLTDIEPEDVKMLTSVLTQRKTTGSNWIGGWDADTDSPIGAAMHQLLEKLKAKAKEKGVKEYTRKYETVYSAREPAEQAAKLKKKLAEQERKKKEKDAKKTKK